MKKLLAIISLLLSFYWSNAQIILEHTYPSGNAYDISYPFGMVHLSAGYKYMYTQSNSTNTGIINLYNLNHTLYKSIVIPPIPSNAYMPEISYISDSLFNKTTSDVEYVLRYQDTSTFPTSLWHIRIYNDAGLVLFSADTASFYYAIPGEAPIYNTSNGYKMIVSKGLFPSSGDSVVQVYSLPGGLPCEECSTGAPTALPIIKGENGYILNAYPNPSVHSATIQYQLPVGVDKGEIVFYTLQGREIKRFPVDRTFDSINLTITDLAAGTYLFVLQTSTGNVGSKKMVVIK